MLFAVAASGIPSYQIGETAVLALGGIRGTAQGVSQRRMAVGPVFPTLMGYLSASLASARRSDFSRRGLMCY